MKKVELLAIPAQVATLDSRVSALEAQTADFEKLVSKEENALDALKATLKAKFNAGTAEKILETESRAAGAKRLLESHQTEISSALILRNALKAEVDRAEQLVWLENLAIEGQAKLERAANLLEEISAFLEPRAPELEALAGWWRQRNFHMVKWAGYNSTNGVPNDSFFRLDGVLEYIRQSENPVWPDSLKAAVAETAQWAGFIASHLAQNLELALEPVTLVEGAPLTAELKLPPAPTVPPRDISSYVNQVLGRTETPSSISPEVRALAARVGRKLD